VTAKCLRRKRPEGAKGKGMEQEQTVYFFLFFSSHPPEAVENFFDEWADTLVCPYTVFIFCRNQNKGFALCKR